MKSKKNKGFTLIELMVVITIILVMLGFLIPKLYGYQQKAKQTKAINTAKQIQTAAMASYSENDQKFDSTDVLNTIGSLTGVDTTTASITTENPVSTDQIVGVKFISDSTNYIVEVDSQSSSFIVKDTGGNEIFPEKIAKAQ